MSDNALLKATLQWYLDQGVDEILSDEPADRTKMPVLKPVAEVVASTTATMSVNRQSSKSMTSAPEVQETESFANISAMQAEATSLAANCKSLDELAKAIAGFDGLSIKKTAANMVFADGNPDANVMVIGEAPASDDDRQGKAFMGPAGALLDRILASIELDRNAEAIEQGAYLTNMLNWRPPGNRTPSQGEINISLPFIRRHIELASPKILILLGGGVGKALLDKELSISKLRGSFHDFKGIPTIVTYHPSYLLTTPAQKRSVWKDVLMFDAKREELGLK